MITARAAKFVCTIATVLLVSFPALSQSTFFTPGNVVVAVEGCGAHGGTCTNVANGTGNGTLNSSVGGYGDNQAAPLTLFQYQPNGTTSVSYINSLVFPQNFSAASFPVIGEYGSSSEATLQLSGGGQYLTIMGYGVNTDIFNANPPVFGGAAPALAQSSSLTGKSYTPLARVLALVDANGNVNSSTAVYNIFDTNNPRSAFTLNGTTAYLSGQGSGSDATGGVFFVPLGAVTTNPTAITGLDTSSKTIAQDTRTVQIINNTLYVSVDSKEGSGSNRDYIGTLGSPPATGYYNNGSGPTMLTGFGNTGGTGKITISTGANSNGNNLNAGLPINLSSSNYFFASASVLYVADTGNPKNDSNGDNNSTGTANIGNGGLEKWINSQSNGSGTWSLAYTLWRGLNLVNNGNSSGTSGLYGLAGTVSGNNVYLYATNSTLNDLDYTYLYGITDNLTFTTASQAASETFTLLDTAPPDSNFKGVSFVPTIQNGSVEITTTPPGLTVATSGTGCAPGSYVAPVTLAWTPGSSCTLTVSQSPVVSGAQYAFAHWGDGTTNTSDIVTAPTGTAVYNATFNLTPAGVYSPAPGTTLPGYSAAFQWFGYPGTMAFWIDIGSTVGASNYYQSGSLPNTTLSATVNTLPTDGSTVYVRLYSLVNGQWQPLDFTYNAFNGSNAKGVITTPAPGSNLAGGSVPFTWSAGTGATAYWIDAGSTPGGNQYFQSGNLGNLLTMMVSGLPTNGSTVYVTLFSYAGGQWLNNQYTYTAYNQSAALAVMQSPMPGSTLSGNVATFTWSNGNGTATGYWLDIGSSQGGNNYYQSGNLGTATTTTVYSLPADGSQIYVTLWSYVGGRWAYNQYTYISGP
ncbi:MAG TPA: hypothetical protein VLW48_02800 [Candidatus Bathyarchaeia archaeon]|nr:hypothetical protein [Candidatus Bathyarchaeia archaeon]